MEPRLSCEWVPLFIIIREIIFVNDGYTLMLWRWSAVLVLGAIGIVSVMSLLRVILPIAIRVLVLSLWSVWHVKTLNGAIAERE